MQAPALRCVASLGLSLCWSRNLWSAIKLLLYLHLLPYLAPTKKPQAFRPGAFSSVSGAPGGIRTHDPCLRRAVLYPAELRMLVRATSYPCRPWASMPLFARPPVGIRAAGALCRASRRNTVELARNTLIRKMEQMRRFRSFFRTDYCPAPPLILGFV